MDLSNTTQLFNSTTTTPAPEDKPENVGAWFGILIAILIGSIGSIFVIIGLCIVWHTIYMKFFKKKAR
jgi:hypothetical protein